MGTDPDHVHFIVSSEFNVHIVSSSFWTTVGGSDERRSQVRLNSHDNEADAAENSHFLD